MKKIIGMLFLIKAVFAYECCNCQELEKAVALLIQKVQQLEMRLQTTQLSVADTPSSKQGLTLTQTCPLRGSERFFYLDPGSYLVTKRINIRSCPNRSSGVLGQLEKGSVVRIKGCNRYGWCLLEDGGYVAGYLLKKDVK